MGFIDDILNLLISFFDTVFLIPLWLLNLILVIFNSVLVMLKDLFYWLVEALMYLALSALASFDLSAITPYLQSFNSLNSEILNVLGLIGFGECMVIISTALLIRLALQLIPFVRLGS
jgi:hypothetical protein